VRTQQVNYLLELSAAQLEALRIAVDLALDRPARAAEKHKELEAIKEILSPVAPTRERHSLKA
jgi:hypothetical protein